MPNIIRSIDSRLELFTDRFLIESLTNVQHQLHHPQLKDVSLRFDAPWEGLFAGFVTVLKDGSNYKMYYRGKPAVGTDGSDDEVTCFAHSTDSITWTKPELGLTKVHGSAKNNVVFDHTLVTGHNFSPFLDTRPGVDPSQRYKGIAGVHPNGVFALVSSDGVHWRRLQNEPILTSKSSAFDSQNVAFWSESEEHYVLYFRTWKAHQGSPDLGYRWISRVTSPDFLHWDTPVEMDAGDSPPEHLYTNQTQPYFRAPHLYVSVAARFQPGKQVLTDAQSRSIGALKEYCSDCSDAVLMTSRGGSKFDRTFMESFIRPGIGNKNWVSRTNYPGLGIVPTGESEISIYVGREYGQATAHVARYSLRTDGFASIQSPYSGGEMVTRPLIFSGKTLTLNCATSAAGSIQVELQDNEGRAFPGYALSDCLAITGDEISRVVQWKRGSDVRKHAGKPVKIRFVMTDSDLYAIQFVA